VGLSLQFWGLEFLGPQHVPFIENSCFDDRGKVRLSMKVVDQETGEEMKKEEAAD
jgi:hypothetical protein